MRQLFFVFIGGGLGSVLRYIIGRYLNNTLSQNQTLLLATGFCGGFTTFSTFAYENHVLFKSGDFTSFALYTFASFIVAFLAVFAGMYLSRMLS